ncbi:hypothetical protein [Nocardioides luteus]|uniref:hypothetical protein n=1 Tax=Nocardioides luteus TaxID=1844 RepID=UPI0018CABAE1|nr:hypothetical protein [Nocardioides luteus]MBG6094938.1 hypothetical protein [Nocardioides luteus]
MRKFLEHIGIVASITGLLFVAVRLFSVSGGSTETAFAILQSQGTGTVLLSAILTCVPIVPLIAINLWIFWIKYSRGTFILVDIPIVAILLLLVGLLTPWFFAVVFISVTAAGEVAQNILNRQTFKNAFQRVRDQVDKARKSNGPAAEEGARTVQSEASETNAEQEFTAAEVNSLMPDITPERRRILIRFLAEDEPERVPGLHPEDAESFRDRWNARKSTRDVLLEVLDELTVIMDDMNSPAPMRWRGLSQRISSLTAKVNAVPYPDWERCSEVREAISNAEDRAAEYEAFSKGLISAMSILLGIVTVALVGISAIFFPMWAPLERVEHADTASVGYVLGHDDDELVILMDRPRGVVRVENVTRRSFCTKRSVNTRLGPMHWMADPAPILGFVYPPRLEYPSCARPTPDEQPSKPRKAS